MPFEKVETQVDFPAQEQAVLEFWNKIDAFNQLREKNRGKPKWSFLDGPITANNPMGVHHAWGRTYKDAYNRFFAMTGHELRYQQGFDCQGLWVEVEVEKQLKECGVRMESKRDIENLVPGDREASIAKFVQMCKQRVDMFARIQTNQSIRLGYWFDLDVTDEDWAKPVDERKSYFTMSEENNYTIWSFLKKCHQRNLIYRGYDAMPWCGRCGVGISEQEKAEGYKLIDHRSVFVKFPLKDRPSENLLVWTTTPWTLTSNVGAAVNPELTYLKVKLKGEIYYVAKGAFKFNRMESSAGGEEGESEGEGVPAGKKSKREWIDGIPHLRTIEQMFKEKAGKEPFEIVGEVKGAEMLGWTYTGPFDELPAQQHPFGYPEEVCKVVENLNWAPRVTAAASHRIIAWKDVGETEGTGIVHIAPGCGQADFVLGKEHGIPPVAPLDDTGCFVPGFGELSGMSAVEGTTADKVFESLKAKDRLFMIERYVHKYPHCWRCKTELLFRLVDEWFINMSWRNDIMAVVKQVTFLPESVNGQARELDWLKNMGDWMISKKRFWGLALPIWIDEKTGDFEVIGSRAELKERAVEGWKEFEGNSPHRPWVDRIKIRNPKTGNLMSRIPDVGNPWLDAGIVAFSTMKFNADRKYWSEWYPADFITESFPGQFRNWFYALLAMSTMMSDGKPPFKVLLGFATVRDQFGKEMHKSEGNSIEFNGAAGDGYELFHILEPNEDSKKALALLPKGYLSTREDTVTIKGRTLRKLAAKYKPIGADVIRWMYCRQNPASNINFGPETTDEVRARFILKLWNSYAFLCNYARLDGFDPTVPQVSVKDRPDIDRWILSDLQALIEHAREAYRTYNVMAFCLELERFLDDRLSNWYIRRNRRRFQKSEIDADKLTAYQTLYKVLTDICKLCAPVIPFITETMWQNLRTRFDPESVHLCDFPAADPALVDEQLSTDMDALLNLISLGGSARNVAKQKVRQPLAELKVQPGSPAEAQAVKRFPDQILEELNVKEVTLHEAPEPLLTTTAKLNKKTAASKFGPKFKEAETALAALNPEQVAKQLRAGTFELLGVPLESADVTFEHAAPVGWTGVVDKSTQVAIDARVTPELAAEGMARDAIRQIQEHRKNSKLEMEDRIALYLETESAKLKQAIETHANYIAAETLTTQWLASPDGCSKTEVKIEGQSLTIGLRKV